MNEKMKFWTLDFRQEGKEKKKMGLEKRSESLEKREMMLELWDEGWGSHQQMGCKAF